MSDESSAIRDYIDKLNARVPGYVRGPGDRNWEDVSWNSTCSGSTLWLSVSPMYYIAMGMLGIPDERILDSEDAQELSEQFYALYVDLLEEAMK